jgi:CRP/FNR family transcriptional regulator
MLADRQHDAQDVIDVPMGRNDIADYLGLTTETVCRTVSKLKSFGVIRAVSATKIKLLNRDRLEELATGENDNDL